MRRPRDFYETSFWQVDALTRNLPEFAGVVWEPCVGDGSLLARLRENRPDLNAVVTNDLDATKPAMYDLDATCAESWATMADDHGRPDWIITNPPFGAAFAILQHAVALARQGVVIMARLSFMEPTQARGPWLAAHPCDKRITLERYSFTENGKSDNVTTEWLVWARVPLAGPANVSAFGYKPNARTAQPSLFEGTSPVDPVVMVMYRGTKSDQRCPGECPHFVREHFLGDEPFWCLTCNEFLETLDRAGEAEFDEGRTVRFAARELPTDG